MIVSKERRDREHEGEQMKLKTHKMLTRKGYVFCEGENWISPNGSLVRVICNEYGEYSHTVSCWGNHKGAHDESERLD